MSEAEKQIEYEKILQARLKSKISRGSSELCETYDKILNSRKYLLEQETLHRICQEELEEYNEKLIKIEKSLGKSK